MLQSSQKRILEGSAKIAACKLKKNLAMLPFWVVKLLYVLISDDDRLKSNIFINWKKKAL